MPGAHKATAKDVDFENPIRKPVPLFPRKLAEADYRDGCELRSTKHSAEVIDALTRIIDDDYYFRWDMLRAVRLALFKLCNHHSIEAAAYFNKRKKREEAKYPAGGKSKKKNAPKKENTQLLGDDESEEKEPQLTLKKNKHERIWFEGRALRFITLLSLRSALNMLDANYQIHSPTPSDVLREQGSIKRNALLLVPFIISDLARFIKTNAEKENAEIEEAFVDVSQQYTAAMLSNQFDLREKSKRLRKLEKEQDYIGRALPERERLNLIERQRRILSKDDSLKDALGVESKSIRRRLSVSNSHPDFLIMDMKRLSESSTALSVEVAKAERDYRRVKDAHKGPWTLAKKLIRGQKENSPKVIKETNAFLLDLAKDAFDEKSSHALRFELVTNAMSEETRVAFERKSAWYWLFLNFVFDWVAYYVAQNNQNINLQPVGATDPNIFLIRIAWGFISAWLVARFVARRYAKAEKEALLLGDKEKDLSCDEQKALTSHVNKIWHCYYNFAAGAMFTFQFVASITQLALMIWPPAAATAAGFWFCYVGLSALAAGIGGGIGLASSFEFQERAVFRKEWDQKNLEYRDWKNEDPNDNAHRDMIKRCSEEFYFECDWAKRRAESYFYFRRAGFFFAGFFSGVAWQLLSLMPYGVGKVVSQYAKAAEPFIVAAVQVVALILIRWAVSAVTKFFTSPLGTEGKWSRLDPRVWLMVMSYYAGSALNWVFSCVVGLFVAPEASSQKVPEINNSVSNRLLATLPPSSSRLFFYKSVRTNEYQDEVASWRGSLSVAEGPIYADYAGKSFEQWRFKPPSTRSKPIRKPKSAAFFERQIEAKTSNGISPGMSKTNALRVM